VSLQVSDWCQQEQRIELNVESMVLDDVTHLEISAFDSTNVPPHQPMLLFQNVAGALLYGNRVSPAADLFLSILGGNSRDIALWGNDLRQARQAVQKAADVLWVRCR